MYADYHALGFDPTVTIVDEKEGEARYDILVRSENGQERVYRTLDMLSSAGEDHLLCRGTRVWKAILLENGVETGLPVALKDSWVEENREREGHINAQIRKTAAELSRNASNFVASASFIRQRSKAPREDILQTIDKTMMTVLAHGDVFIAGNFDRTKEVPGESSCEEHRPPENKVRLVHYRVVCQEVGKPLADEVSLAAIFKALTDVVSGTSIPSICHDPSFTPFRSGSHASMRMGPRRCKHRQPVTIRRFHEDS